MGTHFFRGSDGNKFPPGFSRNKIRGLTVGTSAPAKLPACPWTAGRRGRVGFCCFYSLESRVQL